MHLELNNHNLAGGYFSTVGGFQALKFTTRKARPRHASPLRNFDFVLVSAVFPVFLYNTLYPWIFQILILAGSRITLGLPARLEFLGDSSVATISILSFGQR